MAKTHRRREKAKIELIPSDVLMSHILLRLPLKSLVCCLCVSKEWDALLKSQTFAKMHLRQITHDGHENKLLAQSTDAPCTRFGFIDCEALDVTVVRRFPFKVTFTHIWFLSSCNGLILVGLKNRKQDQRKFSDLILWNPLTGEYKIFSKTKSPEKVYDVSKKVFELYYSSSDDDYRLLHVTADHNVYIYSLKSDSWRKVDSTYIPNRTFCSCWRPGACLNENLYFLKYTSDKERTGSYQVIRFDTKTEKFTEIPTPNNFKNQISSLSVERGCILLCVRRDQYAIELWKMKGEDGGWMKVATYITMKWFNFHGCLQQLHLLRDGYWLMKSCSGYICKVDLENRHEGKNFEYSLQGFHQGNKYNFHQVKRYIETFVSPNRYVK